MHPDWQRRCIGSRLVRCALAELQDRDAAGVVVLGDPDGCGRFGFGVVSGLKLAGVPPEYFQATTFTGRTPCGKVTYHPSFGAGA